MPYASKKISVELYGTNCTAYLKTAIMQGDTNSRRMNVTLLLNGSKWACPQSAIATLQFKRSDGYNFSSAATVEVDGTITVQYISQMLAAEGDSLANIMVVTNEPDPTNGGTIKPSELSSMPFVVRVCGQVVPSDTIIESDEFNALVTALGEVADFANIKSEVHAARGGEESLNARLNSIDGDISGLKSEVHAARGAEADLSGRFYDIEVNKIAPLSSGLNAVTQRVMDAENNIDTLDSNLLGVANRVTDAEDDIANLKSALYDKDQWFNIVNNVRNGTHKALYPVGYEFTTSHSKAGVITWVVRGHDHHAAANSKLTHTMTLEMKTVYGTASTYKGLIFDAPEAIYYAAEALSAGTYNFTFNYSSSAIVSGTYQFTLTQAVPIGGQIVLGTNSNATAITDCKISTYASIAATTPIENNITVTAGTGGTALGTTGSGNLNHPHRVLWGSNNYAQSGLRQWLNSSAARGSVWVPTNKFDRAPSWHTGTDDAYTGFMNGFGNDFLKVVQSAVIPCRTNSIYEINSTDGTVYGINQIYSLKDKFFLLSHPEIYGSWDSTSYKDGELLEFYNGLTDEERKKYDVFGSVRLAWLRSPYPSHASYERIVYSGGTLYYNDAVSTYGVAAACIIA